MDFAAMLLYMVTTGITPGPSNLMSLYLGTQYGFAGARKFMIGSASAFFVKILFCGVLNVALAAAVPALLPYLRWVGVAYMLYLALRMLQSGFRDETEQKEKNSESSYRAGIILQTVNMKSWVVCLSIFAVYVMPYHSSFGVVLAVSVFDTALMILWTVLWALFGSAFSRISRQHRKLTGIILAAALTFCALSAL